MNKILVKDIMLPLSEYAVVDDNATLLDAIKALDDAQISLPPGKQHHRAVLVKDRKTGNIIGKIGHLSFIKALEPKYRAVGDVERLARAGISHEFMDMMMNNFHFWQDDRESICARAKNIRVKDALRELEESIDANMPLTEAMHRLIMSQSLSIMVSKNGKVVGILRLSDLFDTVTQQIKNSACSEENS